MDKNHPWNKVTLPKPQKRDFADKYTWVVSPRIYDKRTDTHVCCDTGGGPFARQWCTAKAGLVDFGYAKATGNSIQMVLPRSPNMPETEMEWKVPEKSNAIERDRARTYHQAYSALIALHCLERAMKEVQAGASSSTRPRRCSTTTAGSTASTATSPQRRHALRRGRARHRARPHRRPVRRAVLRLVERLGGPPAFRDPSAPETLPLLADHARQDWRDVVRRFPLPLLMLAGRESQIWPCEHAEAAVAGSPRGRALVIEDAGHAISFDQPDRFNEVLLEFLAEVDARPVGALHAPEAADAR